MEAVVSIVKEKTGFSRITCCILVFVVSLILAIPSSLGYGLLSGIQILGLNILDFFDFLSNTLLMPIVALLTCILVGHVVTPKIIIDEVEQSGAFKRKKIYVVIIKYIAPLFLIAILVSSILNTFGIISL
jgi:NSS family neurotransmitter:Na+ symporter